MVLFILSTIISDLKRTIILIQIRSLASSGKPIFFLFAKDLYFAGIDVDGEGLPRLPPPPKEPPPTEPSPRRRAKDLKDSPHGAMKDPEIAVEAIFWMDWDGLEVPDA